MTIDRYLRSFQLLLSPKLTTTVWFIPYRLLYSGKHHHTHHHASVVLKSCRGIWACLRLAQPGAPANVQLFGCIGAVCSIAAITTGVVYRSSLKSYPGRSARKWVDVGVAISPQGFFADGKAIKSARRASRSAWRGPQQILVAPLVLACWYVHDLCWLFMS